MDRNRIQKEEKLMRMNDDARLNHLRGKTFYHICEDNPKYYRTIFIRYNIWTNTLIPHISDILYGAPPPGMDAIAPQTLSYLTRLTAQANPLQDAF